MAVIELDLDTPPAPPRTRPPARLPRPAGLALAVVLLLTLGGAAPITSSLWRPLGVIPLTTDDAGFQLIGDHLFVFENPPDQRIIAAWSLESMHADWTDTTRVSTTDDVVMSRAHLEPADGLLLMQDESFATSVIDPDTGAVLWTADGWLAALGGGRGLIQESRFRPGTEYDQKSGDPGELFWSSTGQPHIEPPLRTDLHGIDMRTGKRRWTYEAPGSVFTAPIDDGTGLLVVATDTMTVLDRDTGKVLRQGPIVREETDEDVAWVEVVDDLVLLRRSAAEEFGTVIAYGTDTLQRRWDVPDPPSDIVEGSCFGLPCQKEDGDDPGVVVLNPRTGAPLWRTAPDRQLSRRGDAVLEMQPMSDRPMRIVDPATGAVRADLTSWDGSVATSDAGRPLVVSRIGAARKATAFGVLRTGATEVQPLGYARSVVFDCASDDRFVVCRVPDGIEAWAYRA